MDNVWFGLAPPPSYFLFPYPEPLFLRQDSTIPSDSLDSEEGDLLESLIEEFVKRNDREPTEDEMQQWRDALREASEEALQAKFKNPTEEAGVELSAE